MNVPGVISAIEIYTLCEAKRRSRLGRQSIKELRAAGLEVFHVGHSFFVEGSALIAAIKKIAAPEEANNGKGRETDE
jgi:hypothetical protein